jgi:hypothetical protein
MFGCSAKTERPDVNENKSKSEQILRAIAGYPSSQVVFSGIRSIITAAVRCPCFFLACREPLLSRILLIHWNQTEAEARAERLRRAGHVVDVYWEMQGAGTKELRANPPRSS